MGLAFLMSAKTWARPGYAVRQKTVHCTMCHASPSGGGPKNLYGKVYGARGKKLGFGSKTDLVSGDMKAAWFMPTKEPSRSKNGFGQM